MLFNCAFPENPGSNYSMLMILRNIWVHKKILRGHKFPRLHLETHKCTKKPFQNICWCVSTGLCPEWIVTQAKENQQRKEKKIKFRTQIFREMVKWLVRLANPTPRIALSLRPWRNFDSIIYEPQGLPWPPVKYMFLATAPTGVLTAGT